jgi:hypothetical protein
MEVDLNGNCNKITMKEDLKEIFKNVNDWLKFAETKNAMLLAFNGVIIFGVSKFFSDNCELKELFYFVGPYYRFVFPVIISVSILLLLFSFIPQTKMIKLGEKKKPKNVNVLFFDHLETLKPQELLEEVYGTTNPSVTNIEKSYAQQIIVNSEITSRKFDTFKVAAWITVSGLLLIVPVIFPMINYYKKRIGKKEIKS